METPSLVSLRRWTLVLAVGICVAQASNGIGRLNAAPTDVILRAAAAPVAVGAWNVVADASAAGGSRLANPNANAAKPASAAAAPAHYFELTFSADAGVPYRLWIRGLAQGNSYENDSAWVQFSDSVTSSGAATWRIGTTSATTFILEQCSGCNVQGWGWNDNGYGSGVLGPLVYFAASGTHTIRVQSREDGLSIDQIVLSPATYLNTPPGAPKNDATILTGGTTPPPSLAREPYLQQVTDGSAIVVWASREPGPAHVRIAGQNTDADTTFFAAAQTGLGFDLYQHVATVDGLAPATTYTYDVFVGGVDVNPAADTLRTAPSPGSGSVRFVVFGDSGTGSAEQRALATLMESDSFDLLLHTGDVAYGNSGGTGDASHATLQSWFFDVYRHVLRRRPMFPSMGNHDARESNAWGRAYLDVFVLPGHGGAGAYPDHAERYYSFDYGPAHFVAIDTERAFQDPARRAAQLAWLDADLAATTQPWKIAYFHRAPYSSGPGHGSDLAVRAALAPILQRRGAQLVLAGHEHIYERLVPWREGSNLSERAMVNVVSGGGGGPLYDIGRSEWTAAARKIHHYVRVTLDGCVATLDAIDRTGTVADRYTFDRCDQAADAAPPTAGLVSPAAGATVSGTITVEASAADDVQVEKVDLYVDGVFNGTDDAAPYEFSWNTGTAGAGAHTLQVRAYDIDGKRATASRTVTVAAGSVEPDVVLYAADAGAGGVHGDWSLVADPSAAGGVRLWSPNRGLKLVASASPVSYVDVDFTADAGVPYHLWLRMKADGNSYDNDSVSVQFSGTVTAAGAPVYRIGTSSALSVILEEGSGAGVRNWGWNDNGYGNAGTPLTFATGGAQTIRIQIREDGASIDQVVLSPSRYFTARPGMLKDDATIVSR